MAFPNRSYFDLIRGMPSRDDEFWVDPNGGRRNKRDAPYGYSEFYIWGGPSGRKLAKDAVYSDRLQQWDHEKTNRCFKSLGLRGWANMSETQASKWMTMYLGRPVEVTALAEGCNISNGYPYWIIWFRDVAPVSTKTEA